MCFWQPSDEKFARPLSGPVRDTPPYRAIPFRDEFAEGVSHPFSLFSWGYRASIAEIPLLRGGYRTSTLHALLGGKRSENGEGLSRPIGQVETPKTP